MHDILNHRQGALRKNSIANKLCLLLIGGWLTRVSISTYERMVMLNLLINLEKCPMDRSEKNRHVNFLNKFRKMWATGVKLRAWTCYFALYWYGFTKLFDLSRNGGIIYETITASYDEWENLYQNIYIFIFLAKLNIFIFMEN